MVPLRDLRAISRKNKIGDSGGERVSESIKKKYMCNKISAITIKPEEPLLLWAGAV